jgi:hypothetical protein
MPDLRLALSRDCPICARLVRPLSLFSHPYQTDPVHQAARHHPSDHPYPSERQH